MISLRKLNTLKPDTRQRKLVVLFKTFETAALQGEISDRTYVSRLVKTVEELETLSVEEKRRAGSVGKLFNDGDITIRRACNTLRHLLLKNMHAEPAEWDLISPVDQDREADRVTYPFFIYLDDIRSPFNVGSIFRTAESFGVQKIYLSEDTASPEHPRAQRTSMGCTSRVPWEIIGKEELPDIPLFALELGGVPLQRFPFPREGLLIIGSEELGVSPLFLTRADNSLGRVSISTGGLKGSLNVSVAFGIVQSFWYSKITGE